MCNGIIKFWEKDHRYECNNQRFTSVSTLIKHYSDEFNEELMSWYTAIRLWYVGDYYDENKKRMCMDDPTIVAHYPEKLWSDRKKGQKRKFFVNGTLQEEYLLWYVDTFKHKEELAILRQRVLDRWAYHRKRASDGGTKYHNEQEAKTIYEKYGVHIDEHKKAEKERGYKVAYTNLFEQIEDGDEPELLIYDLNFLVAGQADRPRFRTKGKSRYVKIFDYKTNYDGLEDDNKYKKKFKAPIAHVEDTKYFHYALQQSIYGYMLEKHGFIYEGGVLEWRKIDFDTGEILASEDISVPYLKNEAIALFDDLKRRRSVFDRNLLADTKTKEFSWDEI